MVASPSIPRGLLDPRRRAGRPVLDVLRLPITGAASGVAPGARAALAHFANRAAAIGADLEVSVGVPWFGNPGAADRQAWELARLAAHLGALPAARAWAVPSVWAASSGTDAVILLVQAEGAAR
jgi:hypothetical protein